MMVILMEKATPAHYLKLPLNPQGKGLEVADELPIDAVQVTHAQCRHRGRLHAEVELDIVVGIRKVAEEATAAHLDQGRSRKDMDGHGRAWKVEEGHGRA